MASLLSLLGGSSGLPTTLTDEEQEALLQQQNAPTTGLSALMGVAGPDSTSETTQPLQDATTQSLLNSLGQGDSKNVGSDANPSYSTDSQKADDAATQTAEEDAASASKADASTDTTDASQSTGDASTDAGATSSDATTAATTSADDQGPVAKYLHKILDRTMSDPAFGTSLLSAGAGMLANTNYGTSGFSAVGKGIQQGQQTYNSLHQQMIQNDMARLNYQRQAQLAQANIDKANATTRQTNQTVNNLDTLRKYMATPGQGGVTPQGILANGGTAETVKAYFPDLTVNHDDVGNVYAFNPRTGTQAKIGTQSVTKATPITDNVNVYSGTGKDGQPNVTTTQTGGMPPAEISKAVQPYHEAQAKAEDQVHQYTGLMGALQTKDALSSLSNQGGVLGAAAQKAYEAAGIFNENSTIRQMYQRMNVTQEMSLLPPGARPNQFIEKQLTKTQADPGHSTPEQMLQSSAFNMVMANVHSVDNAARAAYVSANGGNEADLTKPTTITLNGQQKTYGKGTSIQQVADDAKKQFVDYKPPLINPAFASQKNVDDKAIQAALAMAKDPKKREQLVKAGVLMKPIFGGE